MKVADRIRRHRAVEHLDTAPDIFVDLRDGWRLDTGDADLTPGQVQHGFGEDSLSDAWRTLTKRVVPCTVCPECIAARKELA